ncbi:RNA polymerase sigma factor [Streptomyces sp. YIM 121038]|uniref:helix-turn-helix domain-containing protein n=1 Tax=Streptomyces sp. YIM 121038 TaxID=2136401 RepID=UPI001165A039|nr:helix-turn-helix domain-containing protein [Streptomyces sp. YIM 121038]QCX78636.1 RNA polymerase sigma factor [Streptomyces sp. YIM 121038]
MTQSPASPKLTASPEQGGPPSLPPPEERRRLRETKPLSQAQLAALVGVTRETVRSWESGRTEPRGSRRAAYAKLLESLAEAAAPPPCTPAPDAPAPAPDPAEQAEPAPPATAEEAFDALCARTAPALLRQTYALTGHRALATESVERAFQLAWQRWPEVAVDRDPAGWVRAAAHEYALSPWHRFRPALRHPDTPPADASDRAVLDALLGLPPAQRRTLMLYDGVGLDLPETAAETEASTPTAAGRLLSARGTVAAHLPGLGLADRPGDLAERLTALGGAERLVVPRPARVRTASERRARLWTRAAIAFTALIVTATALTLRTAPTRYEPPVPSGKAISGVPPRMGPGPLTPEDETLKQKLRSAPHPGPERLTPQAS